MPSSKRKIGDFYLQAYLYSQSLSFWIKLVMDGSRKREIPMDNILADRKMPTKEILRFTAFHSAFGKKDISYVNCLHFELSYAYGLLGLLYFRWGFIKQIEGSLFR